MSNDRDTRQLESYRDDMLVSMAKGIEDLLRAGSNSGLPARDAMEMAGHQGRIQANRELFVELRTRLNR